MAYKVFLTRSSKKELDDLTVDEKEKILSKMILLDFPFPDFFNIKKMSGAEDSFRLKTGKIRVIFFIDRGSKELL